MNTLYSCWFESQAKWLGGQEAWMLESVSAMQLSGFQASQLQAFFVQHKSSAPP